MLDKTPEVIRRQILLSESVNETMLDDCVLEQFISTFLGYGNLEAPVWFTGMEEGGGRSLDSVQRRLEAWKDRGSRQLEDLREFHIAMGVEKFWTNNPPTQRTWNKLIRLYLSIGDAESSASLKQVKQYQRDQLGQVGSKTCLMELLPLPSPGTDTWSYGSWSKLSNLADRDSYQSWLLPKRIDLYRQLAAEHQPPLVVFYGFSYLQHWQAIAGNQLTLQEPEQFYCCTRNSTCFIVAKHPSAARSNEYWSSIGQSIRRMVPAFAD